MKGEHREVRIAVLIVAVTSGCWTNEVELPRSPAIAHAPTRHRRAGGAPYPQALPTTLVFDRDGRLVAHHVGALDEDAVKAIVDPLVTRR